MEGIGVGNGISRTALADTLPDTTKIEVRCTRCGSDRVFRLFREGFLRKKIYPLFGYYPWKCRICGAEMMLRKRRRARTKKGTEE